MAWGCWLPDGRVVHLATYGGRGEWTSRCNTLGVLGHERDLYPQMREQPRWHHDAEPGRVVNLDLLEQAAPDLPLCRRCVQRWLWESDRIELERLRRG